MFEEIFSYDNEIGARQAGSISSSYCEFIDKGKSEYKDIIVYTAEKVNRDPWTKAYSIYFGMYSWNEKKQYYVTQGTEIIKTDELTDLSLRLLKTKKAIEICFI